METAATALPVAPAPVHIRAGSRLQGHLYRFALRPRPATALLRPQLPDHFVMRLESGLYFRPVSSVVAKYELQGCNGMTIKS